MGGIKSEGKPPSGSILAFLGVCFVSIFVGLAASSYHGSISGRAVEREKAIEAGVGRWVVNAKTGKREFVYGPVGGKP